MPSCYPTLASNTACPRHLCTSKPGSGDGGVGEEVRVKLDENLKMKLGEDIRTKLGEDRMYDLGRGEDRPKLQTPRVSTR